MFKLLRKYKNGDLRSFNSKPGSDYSIEYKKNTWNSHVNPLYVFSSLEEAVYYILHTDNEFRIPDAYEDNPHNYTYTIFSCSVVNPKDVSGKVLDTGTVLPNLTVAVDSLYLEKEYELSHVYKVVQEQEDKYVSFNTSYFTNIENQKRCLIYDIDKLTIPTIENSKIFTFATLEEAEEYIFKHRYSKHSFKTLACIGLNAEKINDSHKFIYNGLNIPMNTVLCDAVLPHFCFNKW